MRTLRPGRRTNPSRRTRGSSSSRHWSRPTGRSARNPFIEPKALAAAAAHLAEQKKGADIKVYDVSEHIKIASYFVLVTGNSRPQVKAIASEIHSRLKELGERHSKTEGADLGWWVLLDYVDVVVHVLQPDAREFYALDMLYGECPVMDVGKVAIPEELRRSATRIAE